MPLTGPSANAATSAAVRKIELINPGIGNIKYQITLGTAEIAARNLPWCHFASLILLLKLVERTHMMNPFFHPD